MLCFNAYGSKHHPAIIFLHGLFGSKQDMHHLCEILKENYYCIALDLPGFGSSPFHSDIPLLTLIQDGILDIADHLSLSSFHLAGYSLGGRIALDFAFHTNLLSSLIILSANIGIHDDEKREKEDHIQDLIHRLDSQSDIEFLHDWYNQSLFNTLANKLQLKDAIIQKRLSYNKEVVRTYITQLSITKQQNFYPLLQHIKKGLFCYGEKDTYYKVQYCNIKKYNSCIKVEEIKDASHAIIEENTWSVAQKIKKFLE